MTDKRIKIEVCPSNMKVTGHCLLDGDTEMRDFISVRKSNIGGDWWVRNSIDKSMQRYVILCKYKYNSYVKMHDTLISKKSLRTKEYSG